MWRGVALPRRQTHLTSHAPTLPLKGKPSVSLNPASGIEEVMPPSHRTAGLHTPTALPLTVLTGTLATQANWFMDNINYHVAH